MSMHRINARLALSSIELRFLEMLKLWAPEIAVMLTDEIHTSRLVTTLITRIMDELLAHEGERRVGTQELRERLTDEVARGAILQANNEQRRKIFLGAYHLVADAPFAQQLLHEICRVGRVH